MAVGFDFDVGDARGTHRLGTTPADRMGWDMVKATADAAIQSDAPTTVGAIRTNTGDTTITVQEWPAIQLRRGIKDAIDAGTVTTKAEIDAYVA